MSESAISSSIVPEALNNNNYKIWRSCMKDYFSSEDLWEVVNGNVAEDTKSPDWRKKNGKALHAIKISCGPKILTHIGFAERASDAWKQLERIQEKREKGTSESLHICIDIEPQKEDDDQYKQLRAFVREGNLNAVSEFMDRHKEAVRSRVTSTGGTALHAAIVAQQVEIVEFLVSKMELEDLKMEDKNLFTALDTIAAQIGDEKSALKMAQCIASKHPKLVTHGKVLTPILIASAHGHQDMTRYLYKVIVEAWTAAQPQSPQSPYNHEDHEHDTNILDSLNPEKGRLHGTILLSHCITGKMFDVALDLLERFPKLAGKQCAFIDPVQDLCKVPSAFPSGTQEKDFSWKQSIKSCLCTGKFLKIWKSLGIRVLFEDKSTIHSEAKIFLESICKKISTFDDAKLEETSVREAMLEAAKNGTVEFITEMGRANQRLMWFFDDDRRNIFSYAIIYRQEKVFNLIYGLSRKVIDDLTNIVDSYDNNMLHLAAAMPESTSSTFHRTSGAALQMQRELQWFKEVEKLCRPSCKEMLNQDGLCPRELFTKSHKEMVKEGELWMKATAQSSTVVGALIITIMFAAALKEPGGSNHNTRLPKLVYEWLFKVFIVSDALSFFSSLTSVLMFLGILTSRYAEDDFLVSLPGKLIIGLASLCFSLATMMVTFCSALTIMLDGQLKYIIPIGLLSFPPVFLFYYLALYPLLSEIYASTFGPSMFVRTTKFPTKIEDKKSR